MARIKNTTELDQQYIKRIARELYKRNVELAVRNKTFSLLRKLYDITISPVVSLEDIAFRLATEIRQDLNFEMVGIYILKEDSKELESLAVVSAERLAKAFEEEKITSVLNTIKLKTNRENACASAVKAKKNEIAKGFAEIWPDKKFSQPFFNIQKKLPIKTIIICPLLIEEKILGTLIIVLNREYKSLSIFEKETIESFINVIAVALAKTMAYEQLEKANIELQRLSKAKSEFISIASHQLRTPLTAIKGYISMILEGSYGKFVGKAKTPMENVYKSNERLINLVNNLLSISRIESGKMEFESEEASIEEIIIGVINELKITAEKRKLYLKWEKPKIALPKILLDKDKIRQVILNLVDNAIKYTQKGGITIKIKNRVSIYGNEGEEENEVLFAHQKSNIKDTILIEIKDTGEGMTEEELGKIFESFSRGAVGTKAYTEGAGLGLYIARRFVEMHNGRVWAESEGKDKGSTFYIELPMK